MFIIREDLSCERLIILDSPVNVLLSLLAGYVHDVVIGVVPLLVLSQIVLDPLFLDLEGRFEDLVHCEIASFILLNVDEVEPTFHVEAVRGDSISESPQSFCSVSNLKA